jgi:hypothetical protein
MNTNQRKQNAKYFQCKEGRNDVLVLPTSKEGHPFAEWWVHKALIDPSKPWIAVACDKHNDGGECVICDMAQTLKDQSFKGNEALWKPLEAQKEMYSPVIDLADVDAGVQWWSYGRSISSQFETWLRNIEEGETAFYDPTAPQKIIVNYDKNAAPKDKYKLDKKNLKPLDPAVYEEWFGAIKPIDEIRNNRKPAEEKEEILGNYIRGKEKALKAMTVAQPVTAPAPKAAVSAPAAKAPASKKASVIEEAEEEAEEVVVTPKAKSSKLNALKEDGE